MIQIKLRYPIGIAALSFVGLMGGDVFMTAIEFGGTFALLDWLFERN